MTLEAPQKGGSQTTSPDPPIHAEAQTAAYKAAARRFWRGVRRRGGLESCPTSSARLLERSLTDIRCRPLREGLLKSPYTNGSQKPRFLLAKCIQVDDSCMIRFLSCIDNERTDSSLVGQKLLDMARASTKSPTAANGVVALTPDTVDSAPLHPQEV
jgi:hypothetical protein